MGPIERQALLDRWMRTSSDSEQDRMERAERMVRQAVENHPPFAAYLDDIAIYAKGSYANQTNVRLDSDVDIVVENRDLYYYDYFPPTIAPSPDPSSVPYVGRWNDPGEWRAEVRAAIVNAFGTSQVDTSGHVAMTVLEVPGSRPSADVVPSFLYKRFESPDRRVAHIGSRVFTTDGKRIDNWPQQQKANGRNKDTATHGRYKQYVRALKNAENHFAETGELDELPSYFMECLVWNVPNNVINHGSVYAGFQMTLAHLVVNLDDRDQWNEWEEPNRLKWLFRGHDKWTAEQGRDLALAAYSYLDW